MSERLAAYGATAALVSGVVAALGTVFLFLTFATQASTLLEPVTELTPLDRAANGLGGLAMLLAIPVAFRLHQSWRAGAPLLSGTALAVGVISLLAYGILLLVFAAQLFNTGDVGTLSVVPLGGVGLWIILVSLGRADRALGGIVRWIGLAIGVGNLLLLVAFYGGGGTAAVNDPKLVFESPLLLAGVFASLLSAQIGYPIWAIWLGRRLQAQNARDNIRS
jgi:hypothetical protein